MKIGIDCRIFGTGFTGIGRYTEELVTRILDLNHSLDEPHEIVLFFNDPEYSEFRSLYPVKTVKVNARHYSVKEQVKFLRLLNKEKCDVVHFPHFNVPLLYKGKFTVTIHDLTLEKFPGKKMTKWYHRMAYKLTIRRAAKRAKKVIAVSEHTKMDAMKFLKLKDEGVEVIYNGVGEEFRTLSQEEVERTMKRLNIKQPYLLYTGVWRSHKNLPRLIEALGILVDRGMDINLVMTGKEDPNYPEVMETVSRLKLEDRLQLPGKVAEKDLVGLYNGALFYVFPSLYEGFGLPPLEAMSCDTPVVASLASCIPEICGEDNAVYFDPHNQVEIADKIMMLYNDLELQNNLRERGRERVKDFSWQDMAEETFKILRNV